MNKPTALPNRVFGLSRPFGAALGPNTMRCSQSSRTSLRCGCCAPSSLRLGMLATVSSQAQTH
ncbi:MAG: hypothetical protein EPN60_02900 [Nevskiaceae bacterium]|nr:MAG: hypothetical protein EPO48_02810 [Nevskiaceae bacterium]TAM32921.1 MAG: hypothetical protein EPN60_02900 [Nevskiaceae bacterium]